MVQQSGVLLDILSSLQFYTGHNIKPGTPGREGRQYKPRAGLCFETQGFPDAVNHPTFPSTILRLGQTYRQIT
jgi:aldose 1-epimerase